MKQPTRSDDLRSTRRRTKQSRPERSGRRSAFEPLEPRLVLTVSLRSGAVPDEVVLFPDAQPDVYQIAAGPIDSRGMEIIDLSVVTDDDQRYLLPHPESLDAAATLVRIDPQESYTVTARSFNPAIEPNISTPISGALKVKTYDVDQNLIELIHVSRHDYAVDTTLAATLSPGDDEFYIVDASGWSNTLFESAITRAIAWYGYTDSTGHTYDDYTYTRNVAVDPEAGLWEPGGISYDADAGAYQIDLLQPWDGPTLATGSAIRNAVAAQNPFSLGVAETKGEEHLWVDHAGTFGGGVWQDGVPDGQTLPPGTAYLAADFLDAHLPFAKVVVGPTQDFAFAAPSDPLRPTLGVGGDQRLRLEFDVLSKGALPSFMPGMAGNFDNDDNLDGSDFLLWQRGQGSTYDAADLDDWQENYGSIGNVVLAAVETPDHGNAQIITNTNGQLAIDYQSAPWFVGTDLVHYTLRNNPLGRTFEGTIAVEVLGSNAEQDPSVVAQLNSQGQSASNAAPTRSQFAHVDYTTAAGKILLADDVRNPGLLTFYSDDSQQLIFRLLDGPQHGTFDLDFDGTFEYSPDAQFAGVDTIKFEVFDGKNVLSDVIHINVLESDDQLLEHRMQQIAIAMLNYEAIHGRLPAGENFDSNGQPWLSWRVQILPLLGYQSLYDQFNFDQPWNSSANLPLLSQMPDVFRSPSDSPTTAGSRFQTFTGPDAPFGRLPAGEDQLGPQLRDFDDGVSQTILFVQAGNNQVTPWTKPEDLEFDASNPLAALGNISGDRITIAMADGSVLPIAADIDPTDFAALVTLDGGELIDVGTLSRSYRQSTGTVETDLRRIDDAENNRFRTLSLGILNFLDVRQAFPYNAFDTNTGDQLLSWRVLLLPMLGYSDLYDAFNLDEPWDSPHNLALLDQMPDIYRSFDEPPTTTTTRIQFVTDNSVSPAVGILRPPQLVGETWRLGKVSFGSIRDGFSNTIGFVETGIDRAVPWTQPTDVLWDETDPIASFGELPDDKLRAGMLDGKTLSLATAIGPETMLALATRNDGTPLDADTLRNAHLQSQNRHKSGLQRRNELKEIALAMINYSDAVGRFPSNRTDGEGQSLLSWRVRILPYLEQRSLYDQFHHDEPWDSPHNLSLLKHMPDVFRSPLDSPDSTTTRVQTFTGEDAPFSATGIGPRWQNISDGSSNTIAFVEAGVEAAVPWTKPVDLEFHENNPFSALGDFGNDLLYASFDGAVKTLPSDTSIAELNARITHQGGEDLDNLPVSFNSSDFYVRQSGGDTVTNEFGVDTFEVILDKEPQSDVVVSLTNTQPSIATLDKSQLTFTADNWDVAQQIVIRGVDNFVLNADQAINIQVSIAGGLSDPLYAGVPAQVFTAMIVDDDLLPGDFNRDTAVDQSDLNLWQTAYGQNGNADADHDGDSDGSDFLAWQRNRTTLAPAVTALTSNVPSIDAVLGIDEHEDELDEDEFVADRAFAEATGSSAVARSLLAAAAAEWGRREASNVDRDPSKETSGPWLDDELIERVFG